MQMQLPVLPKWVAKVAGVTLIASGLVEGLRQTVMTVGLPVSPAVTMTTALVAGILGLFARALGDHDGDGTPNIIDPDHPLGGGPST